MFSACLRSLAGLCNLASVIVAENYTHNSHGVEGASAHPAAGKFCQGHVPPAAHHGQSLSDLFFRIGQGNELRIEVRSDKVLLLKASHFS